jgi:hypothetical protein
MKYVIGKEYEFSVGSFVKIEKIIGTTAVVRDRWDTQFECELAQLREKKKFKKK